MKINLRAERDHLVPELEFGKRDFVGSPLAGAPVKNRRSSRKRAGLCRNAASDFNPTAAVSPYREP